MALSLLHATQATGTDAGNGDIHKAEWNQEHAIVMATDKLLGRSTAGTGSVEEIAIGSGLSLSAGTLSASGGGGGSLTISNKTAAYTVVAGDLGTIINCTSGTFTVSLTAAATLGAGFNCWIWNTSTTTADAITIDPAGTETIDLRTTLILRQGEGMQIVCDGTNWQTGDKKVMRSYADNMAGSLSRPIATGASSVAIGAASTASGASAFAAGAAATSSNTASVAIGDSATASGIYSIALGGGSVTASAANSVAIGRNSAAQSSQAVTGSGAMALGGSYASGSNSFAAAVANNTSTYGATGANNIAIGYQAKASGSNYSMAFGYNAISSGTGSLCFALDNNGATASGRGSAAIGQQITASGINSTAMGLGALSALYGKYVYASGFLTARGDSQTGTFSIRALTTDATATDLTTSGYTPDGTNTIILPNNSVHAFTGVITARQKASAGTQSAAWKVEGLIRREGSAGTTTLIASTVTAISNVPGWTLALSANTTEGSLSIKGTGAAATNILWGGSVETTEVTYA